MYLPVSQARFGTLLLLVSRLLLWEGVASAPDCSTREGGCQLQDLLSQAVMHSQNLQDFSMELYNDFFSHDTSSQILKEFGRWYMTSNSDRTKAQMSCHTLPIKPAETVKEANEITVRNILRMLIKLVGAWNDPLHHLVNELAAMPEYPANILSRAKEVQEYQDQLFQDIKNIFLKIHPKGKPKDDFPPWTELSSLKSTDRKTHFLALYQLTYCLASDARKMGNYAKYLKCRVMRKSDC